MSNLSKIKRQRMMGFLEKLKEEHKDDDDVLIALGEIETELNAKKYGLVWEKHEEAVDEKMRTHIPVFTEEADKEISIVEDEICNFLIEGDNLHSLRLLEKTLKGKINVIYIDPPYNTKNKDFIYDDKKIDSTDGYQHSKWLSFMYERLLIAERLLTDTGVIAISIGYHEVNNLMLLCQEIFSTRQIVCVTVQTSSGNAIANGFTVVQEYIIFITPTEFEPFEVEGDKKANANSISLLAFADTAVYRTYLSSFSTFRNIIITARIAYATVSTPRKLQAMTHLVLSFCRAATVTPSIIDGAAYPDMEIRPLKIAVTTPNAPTMITLYSDMESPSQRKPFFRSR